MENRDKFGRFVKGHILGRGYKMSDCTKQKLRESHLGKPGYWKGKIPIQALKKAWEARRGKPAWNKGLKFSEESKMKMSESQKRVARHREACNFWRGGKFKTKFGYTYILKPEHPFAIKLGYVMEHTLVMEQHLGRFLKPEEIVHHKNGLKSDNRIENLELVKNLSEHNRIHYPKGSYFGIHKLRSTIS